MNFTSKAPALELTHRDAWRQSWVAPGPVAEEQAYSWTNVFEKGAGWIRSTVAGDVDYCPGSEFRGRPGAFAEGK